MLYINTILPFRSPIEIPKLFSIMPYIFLDSNPMLWYHVGMEAREMTFKQRRDAAFRDAEVTITMTADEASRTLPGMRGAIASGQLSALGYYPYFDTKTGKKTLIVAR